MYFSKTVKNNVTIECKAHLRQLDVEDMLEGNSNGEDKLNRMVYECAHTQHFKVIYDVPDEFMLKCVEFKYFFKEIFDIMYKNKVMWID